MNAASALYAALAACVTGLAFRELVLGLGAATPAGAPRRERRRARAAAEAQAPGPLGAGPVAVIATGLLFAFSRTLWGYATVAEVYTLNTLLVAACLALVLRWRRASRPQPLLVAAGMVFALGLGVHHVTVALTLPALAVLVLASHPRLEARRLLAPVLVVALVAGLLYATLPLLAARTPVLSGAIPPACSDSSGT